MAGLNGLAIVVAVLTVYCLRIPASSAAPLVTPNSPQGPGNTPNGIADTKEKQTVSNQCVSNSFHLCYFH